MVAYDALSGQFPSAPFSNHVLGGEKGREEWRGCGSRMICGECSIGVGRLDQRAGPVSQLSWSFWSGFLGIRNQPPWKIRGLMQMGRVGILRKVFLEYFHGSIFVGSSHCCIGSYARISLGLGVLICTSPQYASSYCIWKKFSPILSTPPPRL